MSTNSYNGLKDLPRIYMDENLATTGSEGNSLSIDSAAI